MSDNDFRLRQTLKILFNLEKGRRFPLLNHEKLKQKLEFKTLLIRVALLDLSGGVSFIHSSRMIFLEAFHPSSVCTHQSECRVNKTSCYFINILVVLREYKEDFSDYEIRQKILQGADMSLSELNVFYNETVTLQLMDNIFPKMESNMFIVFVDCVKYLLFPINGVLIIIGSGQGLRVRFSIFSITIIKFKISSFNKICVVNRRTIFPS